MIKKSLGLAFLLTASTAANATLISITQTFSNVSYSDYGLGTVQNITSDWIFKAVVDTAAPDEMPWQGTGAFATTVTLTQAELGLVNVEVKNLHYLYVQPNQIGFTKDTDLGDPWTRTKLNNIQFNNPDLVPTIAELTITPGFHSWNGFGPQWDGFELANGTKIYGMAWDGTSYLSAGILPAVPEPETLPLLLTGLFACGATLLRRRKTLPNN